jgi:hypothetical protein
VIFLARHCDGLCGSGHVIELEWIDGHWRAAHSVGTWIS